MSPTRHPRSPEPADGAGDVSPGDRRQRQRLAIARAGPRDPEPPILDEATSDLDSRSEQLTREALARLRKERRVPSIAHRLSTIALADRILVLDRRRIMESGDHQELLALDGRYAKLWRLRLVTESSPELEPARVSRGTED